MRTICLESMHDLHEHSQKHTHTKTHTKHLEGWMAAWSNQSFYKSKTSLRNQEGNNVNLSFEMSAVKVYSLHGSPAEMCSVLITFVSVKPLASRPTAAFQERQPQLHINGIS